MQNRVYFWFTMLGLGVGSGCTAGFGTLLADLFPTEVRNFAMGTTYNLARGVQFLASVIVSFCAPLGRGGSAFRPACIGYADGHLGLDASKNAAKKPGCIRVRKKLDHAD